VDTLDGQDSGLGKSPYRVVIEDFPDLVSRVSEVSSGPWPDIGGFALSQVQLDGMPYRKLPKMQLVLPKRRRRLFRSPNPASNRVVLCAKLSQ
jgi:hypothetical protein